MIAPFLNSRLWFSFRTTALLLPLVLPVAGCGDSGPGDFREYGQLEPVPGAEQEVSGTEAAPAEKQPAASGLDTEPAASAATTGTPASAADNAQLPAVPAAEREPVVALKPGTAPESPADQPEDSETPALREPVVARRPDSSDVPATQPTVARIPRVLIPEQTFRQEGPEGALRVTYDDIDLLKVLNMDPVTPDAVAMMPDWLKQLDGQRVRLRGFMYPPFQETGIQAFALARDNQICCFGKFPKIYDKFPVFLRKGHTTDYILNRSFDVVGVFHIDPLFDEETGEPLDLYLIDDAIVIDK